MDYVTVSIMSATVKICDFLLKNIYSISKGEKKEHQVVCEADLA